MDTKQTVAVRTHLYDEGQLKGLSGSSGPFQPCMTLPSSVVLCAPGTWAAWRTRSGAELPSASTVFLLVLPSDHDWRSGSPVGHHQQQQQQLGGAGLWGV